MKPNNGIISALAFAAVSLTPVAVTPAARAEMTAARAEMTATAAEVTTNGAQTDPGDAWGARSGLQNVRDSNEYEQLVHSNPNFRAFRGRKECGPAEDAPLHSDCGPNLGR
jgi:hypothetical protein